MPRLTKRPSRLHQAFILIGLGMFLNACSMDPNPGRGYTFTYGYANQDTSSMSVEQLLTGMQGKLNDTSNNSFTPMSSGVPVGSVYPFPQKVTLAITAVNADNSLSYNAREINEKYNNRRYNVESDGSLNIPNTTFQLVIPYDFTATFTLTIYNKVGIQYFQGTLTVGPNDTISSTLVFPISVAIDPTLPVSNPPSACTDTDGDTLCDIYEDMFINAAGDPDVDLDGLANSLDSDSDFDGTPDSAEGTTPSVDGYPLFIHKNVAPLLGSNTFTVIKGRSLSLQEVQFTDPDVTDTHTVSITSLPSSGGTASMQTATAFTYTPLSTFVGTESFNIALEDQNNTLDGTTVNGSVTINVIYNPNNHAPVARDDGVQLHRIVSLRSDNQASNGNSDAADSNASGLYSAFWSDAGNLDAYGTGFANLYLRNNGTGTTTQISVGNDAGTPVAPDAGPASINNTDRIAFSNDGRYLVFSSTAKNLDSVPFVPPQDIDTNGFRDIFYYDAVNQSIEQLTSESIDCTGAIDGDSSEPDISGDGSLVVFSTTVTSMTCYTGSDINGNVRDIFTSSLDGYTRNLISVNGSGSQGDGNSYSPTVSETGAFVAFVSESTNLDALDNSGQANVYLKTIGTGALTLISKATSVAANGPSTAPDINDDGTTVVFQSEASNMSKDTDNNGVSDIFMWRSGNVTRISNGPGNVLANGPSSDPKVSRDGRFILYSSRASNLVVGDNNGVEDIFLYDSASYVTRRLSVNSNGIEGNGASTHPRWSADGKYIVFTTRATNLDLSRSDSNGKRDIIRMQLTDLLTLNGAAITVNVGANDSDADSGDTLTNSFIYTPFGGTAVDNNDYTYTYTPFTTPFYGLEIFQYRLSDDQNGSDTADVFISSGKNYATVTNPDTYTIKAADGTVSLDVVANDFDGNDILSLASVTNSALGATISINGNNVVYTPGSTGTDTLTYIVNDAFGAAGSGTITINVN